MEMSRNLSSVYKMTQLFATERGRLSYIRATQICDKKDNLHLTPPHRSRPILQDHSTWHLVRDNRPSHTRA